MSLLRLALGLGILFSLSAPAVAGKCPNLAIVLDKSDSMLGDLAGNTPPQAGMKTRWQIAKGGLATVLNTYDGQLPIGLALYPTDNSCATSGFRVAPAYNTKNAINTVLVADPQVGAGTPTCGAVQSVAQDPAMKDATRGQYILLVTDGDPNCTNCGAASPIAGTVAAIAAAAAQSPPIKTFVIGFGGNLPSGLKTNLDMMARAGGMPNPDPTYDYYPAESEAALLGALDSILKTITSGDAGATTQCDDTCYGNPCQGVGQVCVAGNCKTNPCAGVTCPSGQYCHTDGAKSTCQPVCPATCAAGSRCILGSCQPDACGQFCGASRSCNQGNGVCMSDSTCAGVRCKVTQGCLAGKCVDDPCTFVSCPNGTTCVPFEGSCLIPPNGTDPNACPKGEDCSLKSGCQCEVGDTRSQTSAPVAAGLLFAGLALARRRRRELRA